MKTIEIETILNNHRKFVMGNGGERANLSGAYLSGADLSRADLRDADLRGAELSRADLRDADLRDADLRGADLSGADLSDADLRDADLRGAYLSGAYLSRAELSRAELSGADLSGAYLSGAYGVVRASCSWTDHGERGRELLAVSIGGDVRYFCGCFSGSENDLVEYIENGEEKLRPSRTIALDFIRSRMKEMLKN